MKKLKTLILITLSVIITQAGAPTSGSTTCPTSGAKQVNSTSHKAVTYLIQSDVANTGYVCFGGPNVTTSTAPCIAANQSISGPPQANSAAYDLNSIWMACTVNTDVVKWSYQ